MGLPMDNYLVIARAKIAELIRQDDFNSITSITSRYVYIEFAGKSCRVDIFGRVEWF